MNMPGFHAELSLGPTAGVYRGMAVFGGSSAGEVSPTQEFLSSSGRGRPILSPPVLCNPGDCDLYCSQTGASVGKKWYGVCQNGNCVCKEFILPGGGGTPLPGGGCTSDSQCPVGQICRFRRCTS